MGGDAGLLLVAGALLVVSGVGKLRSVAPTQNALRAAGLPGPLSAVVVLGAVEVAVGTTAVVTMGRPAAAATAVLYVGFAGFVVLARLRGGPDTPCGCFGHDDAPPGVVHLVTTLALATVAVIGTVSPGPGLVSQLGDSPLRTMVLIGYAALVTWLVYLVIAVLPRISEVLSRG